MAEEQACSVFHARESRSFNIRLNNSATKDLPVDHCIKTEVAIIPVAAGFRCTVKYWPHWKGSHRDQPPKEPEDWMINISVVITRMDDQHHQRPSKLLAVLLNLPVKTGMTSRLDSPKLEPTNGEEGMSLTAKRSEVEASCVVDDHFTATCTLVVSKVWPPLPLPIPSRLEQDIRLATSDLADVSFQVEGETLRAHRLVLAARSPVFKAMLFGHMAESHQTSSIPIVDTKASTFKSMLSYMYGGMLPAAALAPETEAVDRILEFQDLYVAADKYGLDTLQQTCEEILCASVSVSTVLLNLEFAEESSCLKLKCRCLDFLAAGENFKEVAVTREYIELMRKEECSLLEHVKSWFKRRRLS